MVGDFDLRAAVTSMFDGLMGTLTDFLPRLLTGLAVVVIGWIVARLTQRAIGALLNRIKLDALLDKASISGSLNRVGVRDPASKWLPRVFFWLILVLFIRTATSVVGLTEIADAINGFFDYLPSVVAAILVLLLGSAVGQFAGRAVTAAADESGVDYAPALGKLVSALVLFVVAVMAIAQLRIDMQVVNAVVLIVFAAFGLAFALSFGLGTREITRNIVAGFYARKTFSPGEEIVIDGERGTLRAITPIMTLIERDGATVTVSNSAFIQRGAKAP